MSSTSLQGGTTKQSAAIAERPILFQTEMVKAILKGRKTQTRRDKGFKALNQLSDEFNLDRMQIYPDGSLNAVFEYEGEMGSVKSPYGKPGDLLWVRESFFDTRKYKSFPVFKGAFDFWYKADDSGIGNLKWKPSIHMPKDAARIWLMIEDIRVERLQDISEGDAIAEGIGRWVETRMKSQPTHYKVYTDSDPEALYTSCPKHSFETLWISINGEESWDSNPWVWVIQFRVLSTTGRPSDEVIQANYKEVRNG